MIFVDSNIPMYLVGAEHPNKQTALHLARVFIERGERMVTSSEVFQEILHRYVAIRRRQAIQPAFDALHALTDEVFAVDMEIMTEAKSVVLGYPDSSARDAVHYSTMKRINVTRIWTFDQGFDRFPGITRVLP